MLRGVEISFLFVICSIQAVTISASRLRLKGRIGEYIGQGLKAASVIQSGQLKGQLGGSSYSCEERFPTEASIVEGYMSNASQRVLLFGWLGCPCTGIARSRFAQANLCFGGRTWANPQSKIMAYLQCREGSAEDHSFVYFRLDVGSNRTDKSWTFLGNGFQFAENAMPADQLAEKINAAGASTACKVANVKVNLYGEPLEECRVGVDDGGSWMDDGTCTEETGGVHQICVENLPADFSSETHQSAWSTERVDKRHCVCIGAWSLYMTDAVKHQDGADTIMPHCKAIPETVLTKTYLQHWEDWNGYPASVVNGVKKLVGRCLQQAPNNVSKCALKHRFNKMADHDTSLQESDDLKGLRTQLQRLSCSEES